MPVGSMQKYSIFICCGNIFTGSESAPGAVSPDLYAWPDMKHITCKDGDVRFDSVLYLLRH